MKAVVTGATGFVGRWLVKELLNQEDEVTVIVRDKKRIPKEWRADVHVLEAPLESMRELGRKDFYDAGAEIFFHLAWNGTAGMERADSQLQLRNVQAACEAVRLAEMLGCERFVNAGSIMEYEVMQYIPADAAEPGMGSIYSTAKLAADFMAKTMAVNAEIAYINAVISNIYGAGERSDRFLNTTLRKMLNNEAIKLTHGKQKYDFIYVSDAVKAMALAGKKGSKNASYYIGNDRQYPLKKFVLQMKEVLGSRSELLFGEVPYTGAMLTYSEFDTDKVKRLGFEPEVDFAQGIALTRDWMMEEESEH